MKNKPVQQYYNDYFRGTLSKVPEDVDCKQFLDFYIERKKRKMVTDKLKECIVRK